MKNKTTRCIAEGAIMVAMALVLSYLKIPIGLAFGGFGGSIDLVMIPLIVYAVHCGTGWGLIAGLVFGTIKYFIGAHSDISWISIIFDYSVAYAFVGFAGLMRGAFAKNRSGAMAVGALIGCVCRFIVHYISGVTVYAQWMPEEFMGVSHMTPALYSLLYNGTYMLPNTILAVVLCALLQKPVRAAVRKLDH
ncbi:MAG: energy-coupled thiamine transporter ThiT [Oscillospiraceae bacterium]|nr:energy-coupled thiamine transporter ThiT [Oscillospiraceae bacterium]